MPETYPVLYETHEVLPESAASDLISSDADNAIEEGTDGKLFAAEGGGVGDLLVTAGAGLNINYAAGKVRSNNVITLIEADSLALDDNATNYIETDDGGVDYNTDGFTEGLIPLAEVTTASGVITGVVDRRAFLLIVSPGLTNSAGPNVLIKSDGENGVASRITDDGTDVIVNSPNFFAGDAVNANLLIGPGNAALYANGQRSVEAFLEGATVGVGIGDVDAVVNGTRIYILDDSKTIDIEAPGAGGVIDIAAQAGIAQSAPASTTAAILGNSQISFWLDEVTHKLMVAVKYSDATVKTGEVALT